MITSGVLIELIKWGFGLTLATVVRAIEKRHLRKKGLLKKEKKEKNDNDDTEASES